MASLFPWLREMPCGPRRETNAHRSRRYDTTHRLLNFEVYQRIACNRSGGGPSMIPFRSRVEAAQYSAAENLVF